MGHPLIDEFCRVPGVANCQPHFFNRCQRVFKYEVQPMIDRLERENAELKARLEATSGVATVGEIMAEKRKARA